MTGAEITLLSSTIANGLPTFCLGRLGKLARTARIETEIDDRFAVALIEARLGIDKIAAGNEHAFVDEIFLAAFPVENFRNRPADATRAACSGVIDRSTMRKSSFAVLPIISFSREGSCRPGTCTRMRLAPWRWMMGSTRPSSLTRRSMIWID